MKTILSEIEAERIRQKEVWKNYSVKNLIEYLPVLVEEVGEVSKEIHDNFYLGKHLDDCRTELIQVAAVCVGMIEKLEGMNGVS